eukprot:11239791-Ditylum_brightwellii.AAC.1
MIKNQGLGCKSVDTLEPLLLPSNQSFSNQQHRGVIYSLCTVCNPNGGVKQHFNCLLPLKKLWYNTLPEMSYRILLLNQMYQAFYGNSCRRIICTLVQGKYSADV